MKKLILFFAILTVIAFSATAIGATDSTEEVITEAIESASETETFSDEVTESGEVLDSEAASEVIDIIEDSESRAEAILALAEKLGITTEEAENIINAVLEVGDEYLGEYGWWTGFSSAVREDMQFWALIIVVAVAILAIIGGTFVLVVKVMRPVQNIDYGVSGVVKTSKNMKEENSQTLVNLQKLFTESLEKQDELIAMIAEKEEIYESTVAEKEERIELLGEQIKDLEISNEKERRSMLNAEMYNLHVLKLICSRTNLALADKAAIDLWFAKAEMSLKSEMSEEDIARIDNMAKALQLSKEGKQDD